MSFACVWRCPGRSSATSGLEHATRLEILNLTAELGELKAVRRGPGCGVVLESTFDAQKGPLATLLVQKGTLRLGSDGF